MYFTSTPLYPLLSISSFTALSLSSVRLISMTLIPFLANANAYALPIPSVAPVTIAHLPNLVSFLPGRKNVLYDAARIYTRIRYVIRLDMYY